MRHKKRNIIGLVLLAIACIAAIELVACRHFAPELYQELTAPVYQGFNTARNACHRALSGISALWDKITAPDEEEDAPVNQLAGEPALVIDLPISDPSVTELLEIDGRQILTGGAIEINYFNQGDETWADQPYGSDNIGRYGCGPTAMVMAVTSMTGTESDPTTMAEWAVEQGYWARKSGSYLSIVEGTAAAFGLHAESLTEHTPEAMREALLSGDLLVALMGPGHFTQGGHFLLIRGITLSGEVLVADPNSTERSLTTWDPQLILDELSTSTSSGAPLWVLSHPEE